MLLTGVHGGHLWVQMGVVGHNGGLGTGNGVGTTTDVNCGPGPDTIGPGKGVKKGRWESDGRHEYNVTCGEPRPKN